MAQVLRRQEDRAPLVVIPNPVPRLARGKRAQKIVAGMAVRPACRRQESALGFLATSHSSLATALLLQALFAVAPDLGTRHRHLHMEVPRDLLLQLFVQA